MENSACYDSSGDEFDMDDYDAATIEIKNSEECLGWCKTDNEKRRKNRETSVTGCEWLGKFQACHAYFNDVVTANKAKIDEESTCWGFTYGNISMHVFKI